MASAASMRLCMSEAIALFAAAGRASACSMLHPASMQPPTIDDIRAAAAAHRRRRHPHADDEEPHFERDHRRGNLAEVREPPVHRRLQGARRAQQIAASDSGGACARRDRGVGRQSCAGGRLSRESGSAFRRRSSCRCHTPTIKVSQTEGHGAKVLLHGAMFDDAYAYAHELEKAEGLCLRPPVRRSAGDRGAGHAWRSKCSRTRRIST